MIPWRSRRNRVRPRFSLFRVACVAVLGTLLCISAESASGVQGRLIYSTYAGTDNGERGFGLALTPAGEALWSGSSSDGDAFLAKLSVSGDAYRFVFSYGGSGLDFGDNLAQDKSGNIWIIGNTSSTNFPLAGNAYAGGIRDGFLVKVDANGAGLFSRYFGGDGNDIPNAIVIDSQDNAWIVGHTNSGDADGNFGGIPIVGGFQPERSGSSDIFVSKWSPTGSLLFSTYLGGSGLEDCDGVARMPDDGIVLVGATRSHGGEDAVAFPTLGGPATSLGGLDDAVIVRLSPSGSLMFSRRFGGVQGDRAYSVDTDPSGNIYVVGRSSSPDFPTTLGAFQTAPRMDSDVFFAKLDASGAQVSYATFLGGDGTDIPRQVKVNDAGEAFIAGATTSTDFPVRDAIQGQDGVGCGQPVCERAVFVSWVRPAGQGHEDLRFSTYLGGDADDAAEALALDASGVVHILGYTSSSDFPRAGDQVEEGYGGNTDVFYSRIAFDAGPSVTASPATATPTPRLTQSPTHSRTATLSPTAPATPSRTFTATPTPAVSPTASPTPRLTNSATPGSTSTASASPTRTSTVTPTRSATTTVTPTPRCGDGTINREPPFQEDCDDGNTSDGDGCPSDCKFGIVLSPRLILGKGLCADAPIPLEVHETGTNRNITRDPDVSFEWVGGPGSNVFLEQLFDRAVAALVEASEDESLTIQRATLSVSNGHVFFAPGSEGIGVNLLRAVRRGDDGESTSNISFVIGGLRLLSAGSLEIEPSSLGSTIADAITQALGREIDDPPLLLFRHGPFCNGNAEFLGTSGEVGVKSLKFDLFGGLISDVSLIDVIERVTGALSVVGGPIGKLATLLSKGGAAILVEQFLDFEVSSEAAMNSQKEGGPPVTRDSVIEVSDSFRITPPFFKGIVSSLAPGLSSVQATFDMEDYCLGKASDSMLVWVAPDLERVEIRNEAGVYEEVLEIGLRRQRDPTVVAMLNVFRDGEEPIELPYDPITALPDRVEHARQFISKWIPGLDTPLEEIGVPIEVRFPRNAMLTPPLNLYREGTAYFGANLTWNPFAASITINDLRLQVPIPRLPAPLPQLTSWSLPVPPNPVDPVASVEPSLGTLTGSRLGNGQVAVDVCVPFFTNEFTGDTNSIRVVGRDLLIAGVQYEDIDGDGHHALDEPGLSGWTIELLGDDGSLLARTTTQADGYYQLALAEERIPARVTTLRLRALAQAGWSPTEPMGGERQGIPIDFDAVFFQNFGAFRDVTVRGIKFDDRNGNAVQDDGEAGLQGWTIEFQDGRGRRRTTTTTSEGRYSFSASFEDFQGAGASIREIGQPGWTQIFPFGGGGLALPPPGAPLHSGVELITNFANRSFTPLPSPTVTAPPSPTFTLTPRSPTATGTRPTLTPTGSMLGVITGVVFEDVDGDGVREFGDAGLSRRIVFLDDNENGLLDNPRGGGQCDATALEACVFSDAGGVYAFVAEPGVYRVRLVAEPSWSATTAPPVDLVVLNSGDSYSGIDFGQFRLGTARGVKFRDVDGNGRRDVGEPGLRGWVLFADRDFNGRLDANEPWTESAIDGAYEIAGVERGPFVVREVERCGFVQTQPERWGGYATVLSTSGQSVSGLDFGNLAPLLLTGDINRDGAVTGADLTAFRRKHGSVDVDGNGRINADDATSLLRSLFDCGDLRLSIPATPLPTPTRRLPTPPSRTPTTTVTPTASGTTAPPPSATLASMPTPSATLPGPPTATATATRVATGSPSRTPLPSQTPEPQTLVACRFVDEPIAIPDADELGIEDLFELGTGPRIIDLDVRLQARHTWIGDLRIVLSHSSSGRSVVLIDRIGVAPGDPGCSGDDIDVVLDDQAPSSSSESCNPFPPALNGVQRPAEPLSLFQDLDASGEWRLHIFDLSDADTGFLDGWCLEINLTP